MNARRFFRRFINPLGMLVLLSSNSAVIAQTKTLRPIEELDRATARIERAVIDLSADVCDRSKILGEAQQSMANDRRAAAEYRVSYLETRHVLGARIVRERDAIESLIARIKQLGAKPLPCSAVEKIYRCAPDDDPCQQQIKLLYDISAWPSDTATQAQGTITSKPSSPDAMVGILRSPTSQVPFFESPADAAAFAMALDMHADKQDIEKTILRASVPIPSGTECEVTAIAGNLAQVTLLSGRLRRETGWILLSALKIEAPHA